ncbi:MAG: hypothetical protein L6Q71_04645 [Planctomycetes bacterium]|nr:hypothetical protein [Planctomycetota bacterium]
MKRLIAYEGHRIVVEFDVLRAFPSISRPRALQNINAALREHDDFVHSGSSEIRKIKFSLWQSMSHVGRCINVNQAKDKDGNFVDVSSEGLLQGMPTASPLFNLALGPVDRVMERIHHDGGAAVTRYVDNFVISAKNMKDAIEAADILQRQLNGLGLQIVQKSEYVDLLGSTEPFKALGLEMRLSEGKFKVQAGLKSAHRLVDFIRNAPSAKAIAQAVKTFIFHYGRHGWMSVAACHRLASMMGQALAENPALRKAKNARNAVSHCAIEYLVRRIAKQSRHKVN